MTAVVFAARVACTVQADDIVRFEDQQRVVEEVVDKFVGSTAPYVVLRFKGGHPPLRVHAGARLDVERPG